MGLTTGGIISWIILTPTARCMMKGIKSYHTRSSSWIQVRSTQYLLTIDINQCLIGRLCLEERNFLKTMSNIIKRIIIPRLRHLALGWVSSHHRGYPIREPLTSSTRPQWQSLQSWLSRTSTSIVTSRYQERNLWGHHMRLKLPRMSLRTIWTTMLSTARQAG